MYEKSRKELLEEWEEGWDCVFTAMKTISPVQLDQLVYIRNMGHTVLEAVNRQLAHYAYHIGQIVFLGKVFAGENWHSLSIPKGKSKEYNADKFDQVKRKEHFTDEFLSKSKQDKGQ